VLIVAFIHVPPDPTFQFPNIALGCLSPWFEWNSVVPYILIQFMERTIQWAATARASVGRSVHKISLPSGPPLSGAQIVIVRRDSSFSNTFNNSSGHFP